MSFRRIKLAYALDAPARLVFYEVGRDYVADDVREFLGRLEVDFLVDGCDVVRGELGRGEVVAVTICARTTRDEGKLQVAGVGVEVNSFGR